MTSASIVAVRKQPVLIEAGLVFGRLTATTDYELRVRPDGRNRCFQRFECSCGTSVMLRSYTVKNGNTSSCGCIHTEVVKAQMTTHGLSKTSAYRVKLNKARRSQKRAALWTSDVEKITATVLDEILNQYNNQCWICEIQLDVVQWDHVHPLSKGGSHVLSNLRPACKDCNGRKGSIHPFTDEKKNEIAVVVRALRATQAHTLPVTDGLEVHDVCLS
jgi:5-methylcytosine-specific restriction endonuclease McrA